MLAPTLPFVHLRVFSDHSIGYGSGKIRRYAESAQADGAPAIALTDYNTLSGARALTQCWQCRDVKAIHGLTVDLLDFLERPTWVSAKNPRQLHLFKPEVNRLHLLVVNEIGWRNLKQINSLAHLETHRPGFPVVSSAILRGRTEGLYALTSHDSASLSPTALRSAPLAAVRHLLWVIEHFGAPNTWVTVHLLGKAGEREAARALVDLATSVGVRAVASGDVRYTDRSMAQAHEVLIKIAQSQSAGESAAFATEAAEHYIPAAQMRARFAAVDLERLCDETLKIAESIDFHLPYKEQSPPPTRLPPGRNARTQLRQLAEEGLSARLNRMRVDEPALLEKYWHRLYRELTVVFETDWSHHFLFVSDCVHWAKANDIPVAPGGALMTGSLLTYALRITAIDPIAHDLYCEPFLRVGSSEPYLPISLGTAGRSKVIEYLRQAHGRDRVAAVAKPRKFCVHSALRECARALQIAPSKLEELLALQVLKPSECSEREWFGCGSLTYARKQEPRIDALVACDPQLQRLVEIATQLDGALWAPSTESVYVAISETAMWRETPVMQGTDGALMTMANDINLASEGLHLLQVIEIAELSTNARCVSLIHEQQAASQRIDLVDIPLDDAAAFDIFSSGDFEGLYHCDLFESWRRVLQAVAPTRFEELVAAWVLCGMGQLTRGKDARYIALKHGREDADPLLARLLPESYGLVLFMEDVMKVIHQVTGLPLSTACKLARAMRGRHGRKDTQQLFMRSASARGVEDVVARDLFKPLAEAAKYVTYKSSAVASSLIVYRSAWLKAHFPAQFAAAYREQM